jgi:hypothetical protein
LVPVKEESSKSIDSKDAGFDSLEGGIVEALRILEDETGIGDHCLSGLTRANRILYVEKKLRVVPRTSNMGHCMKGLGTCMMCGLLMHETISMKLPSDVSIAEGILNRVTIPRWKDIFLRSIIHLQSTEVTHCHCNTHLRIERHTYLQPK